MIGVLGKAESSNNFVLIRENVLKLFTKFTLELRDSKGIQYNYHN